ncbi:hypothetical protein AND_007157 [Anopheles darlingi]|uniref:Uncharacterized protein n=2 Tax=Anopheles darlingi TaxID=43151 RepID=W5J9Q0_ANODA|nr:hypothetical protein AND_007157 [Anopheles darlingi]
MGTLEPRQVVTDGDEAAAAPPPGSSSRRPDVVGFKMNRHTSVCDTELLSDESADENACPVDDPVHHLGALDSGAGSNGSHFTRASEASGHRDTSCEAEAITYRRAAPYATAAAASADASDTAAAVVITSLSPVGVSMPSGSQGFVLKTFGLAGGGLILRDIRQGLLQLSRDSRDDTYMYDDAVTSVMRMPAHQGHWYDEPPYESDPDDFLMSGMRQIGAGYAGDGGGGGGGPRATIQGGRVCYSSNGREGGQSVISLRSAGDISIPQRGPRRGLIVPQQPPNPPTIIPLKHAR